jgi:hypothetical protein
MKAGSGYRILQLKVTLLGTSPPVWRRLQVPSDMTLESLHYVLQEAMGWQHSHLHDFQVGRKRFGATDPDVGEPLDDLEDESEARLADVLRRVGAKAVYTYDFGDGWEHSITLERVLPPEPGLYYPVCTGGERQCPPEDCGGVGGFYNFLEALADPAHEEHEELKEWFGGDFDPEAFSVADVNQALAPMRRRRRTIAAQGGQT